MSESNTQIIQEYCRRLLDTEKTSVRVNRRGILFWFLGNTGMENIFGEEAANVLGEIPWRAIRTETLNEQELDVLTDELFDQLDSMLDEQHMEDLSVSVAFVAEMADDFWTEGERISEILPDILQETKAEGFTLGSTEFYGILGQTRNVAKEAAIQEIAKGYRNPGGWQAVYHTKRRRRDRNGRDVCRTILFQAARNLLKGVRAPIGIYEYYPWEAIGSSERNLPEQLLCSVLLRLYQRQTDCASSSEEERQITEKIRNGIRKETEILAEEYQKLSEYLPRKIDTDGTFYPPTAGQLREFAKEALEESRGMEQLTLATNRCVGALNWICGGMRLKELFCNVLQEEMTRWEGEEEINPLRYTLLWKWEKTIDQTDILEETGQKLLDRKKDFCEFLQVKGGYENDLLDGLFQKGVIAEGQEILLQDTLEEVLEKLNLRALREELSNPDKLASHMAKLLLRVQETAGKELAFTGPSQQLIQYEWLTGIRNVAGTNDITVLYDEIFPSEMIRILYRKSADSCQSLLSK